MMFLARSIVGRIGARHGRSAPKVHEDLGGEALAAGHFVSAGEHFARAAVTYHFAKYFS